MLVLHHVLNLQSHFQWLPCNIVSIKCENIAKKAKKWSRWGTLVVCGWPSMKSFKVKFLVAYRGHIYVLYIPLIGWFNFLYMRTGPKCEKMAKTDLQEATSDLEIEGQGHKTIAFVALPIYTHIPNLKSLTKILFKLSRPKGNLGGGVTVLNPKYPRLSSGDTKIVNNLNWSHILDFFVKQRRLYAVMSESSVNTCQNPSEVCGNEINMAVCTKHPKICNMMLWQFFNVYIFIT